MALPPDRMLCFALYSATHAVQAVYAPLLEPLGLTYPQYLILTTLWQEDGQTVGAIGKTLQLETNTLTPTLKRMAAAGLVERARDGEDERRVRVRLTERGKALEAETAEFGACILERSGMTAEELVAFQARVMALRNHLRLPPAA